MSQLALYGLFPISINVSTEIFLTTSNHYHDMNKTKSNHFRTLFFWIVCTCAVNLCSQVSCASKSRDTIVNKLPQWITTEKIRAGYLYTQNDAKYAALMRAHGLNTVIIKGLFIDEKGIKETLENYREWARACKKEKLHVFAAYNWQPSSKSSSYRRVIYSDGSSGIAPCPRDRVHWQEYFTHFGKIIAELSLEPDLQIDGIFLDCELYGSEGKKRLYGEHTCFCDNCFSSFLLSGSYSDNQLSSVRHRDRKRWLDKKKFLDGYFRFLKRDVEQLAKQYEKELHAVNSNLMLGMYPKLHNWVLTSIAQGLGTPEMPVVLFGTHCYVRRGISIIPQPLPEFYTRQKINGIYLAGFLFRTYGADDLELNLFYACQKASGYWLFRTPMLWGKFSRNESLARGSAAEYWNSIGQANKEIDLCTGFTDSPSSSINILKEWKLLDNNSTGTEQRSHKLPAVSFRGKLNFLFYADRQEDIYINLYFERVYKYGDNLTYEIISPQGQSMLSEKVFKRGPINLRFQSSITGVHLLVVNPGRSPFRVTSSNTPIAALDHWSFHTFGDVEPLYFYAGFKSQNIVILGHGIERNTFKITLQSPKGKKFTASTKPGKNDFRLDIEPSTTQVGIWNLSITGVDKTKAKDAYFHFAGSRSTCLAFRPDWIFKKYQ